MTVKIVAPSDEHVVEWRLKPYRHYKHVSEWYKEILDKHFPEHDFVLEPRYVTQSGFYRPAMKLDEQMIIPARLSFWVWDRDTKKLGMDILAYLKSELHVPDKYAASPESPEEKIEAKKRIFEKDTSELGMLIRRRDFLLERGRAPVEFDAPHSRYVYELKGDGAQETIAGFLKDLVEACSI